jgi:hypothetical protein
MKYDTADYLIYDLVCRLQETVACVIDAQWSRVTYYVDTPRKVITLTTFRKQRQAERQEVARARQATPTPLPPWPGSSPSWSTRCEPGRG